jgi:anaerobic magnesium-protoporphyrin IX monomethyl ester cyclase
MIEHGSGFQQILRDKPQRKSLSELALSESEDLSSPVPVIILIPIDGDLVETPEHLGPGYLLAVMRQQGIDCKLVEAWPERDDVAVEIVRRCQPKLIGIALTTVSIERVTKLGMALREQMPSAHIVAGGPVATFLGRGLLKLPGWEFLDSVLRGEAEFSFARLAEALINGNCNFAIPGLVRRTVDGFDEHTVAAASPDLDDLPWPARDQLLRHPNPAYVRISTSRGCTSKCTFCNAPHAGNSVVKGKIWRGRSHWDVLDELEYLVKEHHVRTFDFVDSTFEDPGGRVLGKERIRALAQGIVHRNLGVFYNACFQAQNWTENDGPLLDLLVSSGLEKVLIGIESGSAKALARWKKRANIADNARAIRLFRQRGVYVTFGFIMFHPFADMDEVDENAAFLTANMGHNLRRMCTRLELYPGAEVVDELRATDLLLSTYDLSLSPYGYLYSDETVGTLANAMASLFGSLYRNVGSLSREPSVFAFETFDIRVHTYLGRLRRHLRGHIEALILLEEMDVALNDVRKHMSLFNAGLFQTMRSMAIEGSANPDRIAVIAREVEHRFDSWMQSMKTLQARYGMKVRRCCPEIDFQAIR